MNSAKEILMLERLKLACHEPMVWWQSYSYSLDTKQGKVYFSASSANINKENSVNLSDIEVPVLVLEDLSEIARDGGAVGSSKWVKSYDGTADAPTYHRELYWADGTQTGPGTAEGQLLKYLRILEKKCAESELSGKPLTESTYKEIALLLKEEAALLSAVENTVEPPRKMPACTVCGSTEGSEKFCFECGQPRSN